MVVIVVAVIVAGAVGGIANAYLTDNGFPLPQTETSGGQRIWRPGVIGNVFVGALAAFVTFALYGPLRSVIVSTDVATVGLTFADVGGAVVTGIGGARILSSEVDKRLLKAAAEVAASKSPTAEAAAAIRAGSPTAALQAAASMPG